MRASLLLITLLASPCAGATRTPALDAAGAAMGGSSVVGGLWAPLWAPAASGRGTEFRVSWCDPYGIDGLQAGRIALVRLWGRVGVGLSMQSLVTPTPYSEARLGVAGSVAAAEGVVLGTTFELRSLRDARETFAREIRASLELALAPRKGWRFRCSAFTPIAAGGGFTAGENAPEEGLLRWGIGLPAGSRLTLVVEEERHPGRSLRRFGVELRPGGGLALRAGATDSPVTTAVGIGVERGSMSFDLAMTQHEVLGATPYLTVSYGGPPSPRRRAEPAR